MWLPAALPLLLALVSCEKERFEDGANTANKIRTHNENHKIDGDVLIGSHKAADAMGALPAAEGKKRLIAVAAKIDQDKDGRISSDELIDWIENSIKAVDVEEANDRFTDIDINNDKLVTWEEYVKDAFPHDRPEELDKSDLKLLSEDEKYFKAADANGDGKLDMEEFSAFLTPENHPHMHAVLVELTTSEKDEDGDGAINLKEFLGEMHENPHSEWNKAEQERFNRQYDTDGDGLLKGEEIKRWLIPDVRETAAMEATHLMERADRDKDGYLSYEEVGEQYELFVSSEATRFGEHLEDIAHEEL